MEFSNTHIEKHDNNNVTQLDNEDVRNDVQPDQSLLSVTASDITKKINKSKIERQHLRGLQQSDRYFWKTSYSTQLDQTIFDKVSDGTSRQIPPNEITVMALNEIAVQRGRGFFLHLKNRDGWKKHPSEELCPASRVPPQPG